MFVLPLNFSQPSLAPGEKALVYRQYFGEGSKNKSQPQNAQRLAFFFFFISSVTAIMDEPLVCSWSLVCFM